MAAQNSPDISVCVCTYKRPALLMTLLQSLARQTMAAARFEIIVVDNDASGSAQETVRAFTQGFPEVELHYAIEPTPGISYARNKTVALASGQTLAFIDDDEWADSNWLSDLAASMQTFAAQAVLGPVIPHYPAGTPAWIIESRFFERPRCATGTAIDSDGCRTSNAMVDAQSMKARQPAVFAERLALSGGEDHDFFRWYEGQGAKVVWCDSAIVNELVPRSRQTLNYMLERCFRTSTRYWRDEFALHSSLWAYQKSVTGCLGGSAFAVLGGLLLPFGLARSVRLWSKAMKGFGRVAALSNITLVGYGKKQ